MRKKSNLKNKKIYLLLTLVLLTISIFYTLGKYVINNENIHIQNAEEFYFNSEILNEDSPTYKFNDWDGKTQYVLSIDLKAYEDSIRKSNLNIDYRIEVSSSNDNITIATSKSAGALTKEVLDDTIQIYINNEGRDIEEGNYITVFVKAIATSPYAKEISATFNIYKKSSEEYTANLNDMVGAEWTTLTIKTNNSSLQKTLIYDENKAILDTTNPLFNSYTTITPGRVELKLEENQIYKIEFIKKDKNIALEMGTDIMIQ